MTTVITGGRVIDPAAQLDGVRDVLIEDSKISAIEVPRPRTRAASGEGGGRLGSSESGGAI